MRCENEIKSQQRNRNNYVKNFLKSKKIQFTEFEKLVSHTSVKIGGVARFFVRVTSIKKLVELLDFLNENEIKYQVLGNGTNTLTTDKLYNGVVICTKKLNKFQIKNECIYAQCGLGLFGFCKVLSENGLGGLEFLYGIPGTVGGAIVMNAGAFGGSIGDFVEYVQVYEDGKLKKISKAKCYFSYRSSAFQNKNFIVLGVKFRLKKSDTDTISRMQKNYFNQKLSVQPYDFPSFGSAFKKHNGVAISKLIDDLGLKGFTIGGAQISKKHAGFIINLGGATCKDFRKMIKYIQMRVKRAYGIVPEPEVKFLE